MASQVQQFLTRTNRMIKEDGLLGISGVRFDRGGKPMDVLKSKRYPDLLGGKRLTVGQVAVGMNAMQDCADTQDGKSIFKKRVSNGMVPRNAGYRPFKFDDSTRLDGGLPHPEPTGEESMLTREILDKFSLVQE